MEGRWASTLAESRRARRVCKALIRWTTRETREKEIGPIVSSIRWSSGTLSQRVHPPYQISHHDLSSPFDHCIARQV